MKLSKVFLLSVFITAIILVVIGGVTSNAMAKKISAANNTAVEDPAANNTTETIQNYQQREAEYNQMIEQANQQLAEANAKLQAMQNQIQQSHSNPQTSNAPAAAILAEKAEEIARQAADPEALLQKKPDLVDFEGKTAYEVIFQKGSIYVDAQTGAVLFNGTVPQQITAEKAAQIASDYLNIKDILQVDQITFRNAPLYRVIFTNGMMVYLDTTGQITYILKSSPKLADNQIQNSGGSTSTTTSSSYHEHEHEGGGDD